MSVVRRLRPLPRIILLFGLLALTLYPFRYRIWHLMIRQPRTIAGLLKYKIESGIGRGGGHRLDGPQTVASVFKTCGPDVRARLEPACRRQGITWPPKRLYLLAFKHEQSLEVWAANRTGPYARIATYPIIYHSGEVGPKRREGDLQVPEGFYRLPVLNPNSAYHLSIRIDYPNDEDIRHRVVPRRQMGGDIYLHGGSGSVGCLAMGDAAIEDLFCLVALTRPANRRILIAPVDFRGGRTVRPAPDEEWVRDLYQRMKTALREFPRDGRRIVQAADPPARPARSRGLASRLSV